MNHRNSEQAERVAERRRREDEAPRLRDVVPNLIACRIELAERRNDATSPEVTHSRIMIVERAPALLVVPCCDSSCKDGGHDISAQLLRGLRDGLPEVQGEDTCLGSVGASNCGRILRFVATAKYKAAEPKPVAT